MRGALAAAVVCGAAPYGRAQEPSPVPGQRALPLRVSPAVVKVEVPTRRGAYALGSGVVVAPQRVITNCHVTRRGGAPRVVRGGQRHLVAAQLRDFERDLCLLAVPDLDVAPLPLAAAAPRRGQPVLAAGYTGGRGLRFSEGHVVALHRHAGAHVIQSSNGFTSGASGGALLDTDGALLGVLTFRLRGGASHYFSAPVAWVRELLDRDAQPAPAAPAGDTPAGLAFWERDGAAQPPFMQAAAWNLQHRWSELRRLAERWSRDEPGEPEAWQHLAVASERLGRHAQARQALARLQQHDPQLARQVGAELALDPVPPPAAPSAQPRASPP